MNRIAKAGTAVALAGALALASATPTFARNWGRTAAAAGIGFAAGTILGSAVASNRGYYGGPAYAYDPYYYGPTYGSSYYYSRPAYGSPAYAYEPAYGYSYGWGGSAAAKMEQSQHTNPGH